MPPTPVPLITFAGLLLAAASPVCADIPFPALSTCTVSIVQGVPRPACLSDFTPPVVRLCPSGNFDAVTFNVVVLSALGQPVAGALLSAYEQTGNVNLANGGSTTAITDSEGRGTISVTASSGFGLVSVCADGVVLCGVEVRSPDVTKSTHSCVIPTAGSSSVAGADITNGTCGFIAHFGTVTPGVNNAWDLTCDGQVSGVDVTKGVLSHFGDIGIPGSKNTCP